MTTTSFLAPMRALARRTLIGLAALTLGGLAAVSGTAPAAAAEGPALWKIEDEDTTVYLFGTVHLLRADVDWSRGTVEEAFAASDVLYLETDISPAGQTEAQQLMQQLGLNPPGTTFSSFFTEEELAQVTSFVTSLGIPMQNLEPLRPWLANLVISIQIVVDAGGNPAAGVDSVLRERAVAAGKELRYFESPSEQIRMIASPSDAAMADSLLVGITQYAENRDMFDDMVELWRTGQTDALGEMMNQAMGADESVRSAWLTKRNANWTEDLVTLMQTEEGTFFVAVGAGHLTGFDSVQTMMAEKGYTAELQ